MSSAKQQKIFDEAHERYDIARQEWKKNIDLYISDVEFYEGRGQWPLGQRRKRESDSPERPCITINECPQFIRSITNDYRKNKPQISIKPFKDGATEETAKIKSGLIRHIRNNSQAKTAYQTSFECAVIGGFGWHRVLAKYNEPDSFEQDLYIERIADPTAVTADFTADRLDYADMQYIFIEKDFNTKEFERLHPGASTVSFKSDNSHNKSWYGVKTMRVAEYYYIEDEPVKVLQLANGEAMFAAKYEEYKQQMLAQYAHIPDINEMIKVVRTRDSVMNKVKYCKINGEKIFAEEDWPGKWIPVIPTFGEEINIKGERIYKGKIRDAKDPQRNINYWTSTATELVALAPKNPYMAAEGAFEGHTKRLEESNVRNLPYVYYKPIAVNGVPVPPPVKHEYTTALSMAAVKEVERAEGQLRSVMGQYQASLGQGDGRERSGKALNAMQQEGDTNTYNFIDNAATALEHTGRILEDLLPYYYDTPRPIKILEESGVSRDVEINREQPDEDGRRYRINRGVYDTVVVVGPSFKSQRQEAAESMMTFVRHIPSLAASVADLIASNQDWPDAEEFADRLRAALPPNLLAVANKKDKQTNAAIMAMEGQMQELQQTISQLQEQLKDRNADRQLQVQLAQLSSETQTTIAEMNNKIKIQKTGMDNETDIEEKRMQEENEVNKLIADRTFGIKDL